MPIGNCLIGVPSLLYLLLLSGCVTTSPVQKFEKNTNLNAYTKDDLTYWVNSEHVDTLVKVFEIDHLQGMARDTMMVNRFVNQDIGFDCQVDTLEERRVVTRATKELYNLNQSFHGKNGLVVVQNCINVKGETVVVRILPETTYKITMTQQQQVAEAFLSYKYEAADYPIYCLECGKLTLELGFNNLQN